MNHKIGKQVINVSMQSMSNAFQTQQDLAKVYWEHMLPALERLFDRISQEDEVILIDRLEIDLGQMGFEAWNKLEFLEKLIAQLEEKISGEEGLKNEAIIRKARFEHSFDQWLFFLENAYLPWQNMQKSETWDAEILESLAKSEVSIRRLRQLLLGSPFILNRLIAQHKDEFLIHLLEVYSGKKQAVLERVVNDLEQLETPLKQYLKPSVRKQVMFSKNRMLFWQVVLGKGVIRQQKASAVAYAQFFFQSSFESEVLEHVTSIASKKQLSSLEEILRPIVESTTVEGPINEIGKEQIQEDTQKPNENEIASLSKQEDAQNNQPLLQADLMGDNSIAKENREALDSIISDDNSSAEIFELKEGESIYLQDAGLVLLHPFIPTYFQKVDLIKDGAFIDKVAQHKAIHLLHFLATGAMETPEYKMVLPKLLCGLALNEPIDFNMEITAAEMEEGEGLLNAVINHWGALGQASPDSLREGFLMREGKLEYRSGSWQLYIEKKTIDLLLDKLPWGIGLIKTPWMRDILHINWT